MKVHILDDWADTLRGLPCFAKLDGHDVTVWTNHQPDPALLAERVQGAEALVLFRERTQIGADLLNRLPQLTLISQRSGYPHIDVDACTANGLLLCSNMNSDTPFYGSVSAWCRSVESIICRKGDEPRARAGRMNFARMWCGSR